MRVQIWLQNNGNFQEKIPADPSEASQIAPGNLGKEYSLSNWWNRSERGFTFRAAAVAGRVRESQPAGGRQSRRHVRSCSLRRTQWVYRYRFSLL